MKDVIDGREVLFLFFYYTCGCECEWEESNRGCGAQAHRISLNALPGARQSLINL